jgi:hypothetical protein
MQSSYRALKLLCCLTLTACSADSSELTGPATGTLQPPTPQRAQQQGAVVASATGGADWVLEVFGFTIPQTLGFSARKYSDGRVQGQINYHQTFLGETFKFNATVTCMSVYDGNRVKYGGEILLSNDPTIPPGTYIWFQGIDNGEGAGAPADQSTGSGFGTAAENQAFCDSPDTPNPLFLAEIDGDIQVSD